MKRDRDVLAEHGTTLMVLKPQSVVSAATADLKRKARNSEIGQARVGHSLTESYQPYAFHRDHVRKAIDARELLLFALMDPTRGLASDKDNTRLLYGNAPLILAAIRIASA